MGHVPENRLPRYRHLKQIMDLLDHAGDSMGSEFMEDANACYRLAGKYRKLAEELRVKVESK